MQVNKSNGDTSNCLKVKNTVEEESANCDDLEFEKELNIEFQKLKIDNSAQLSTIKCIEKAKPKFFSPYLPNNKLI